MSDVKIKVGADLDTRAVDAELAELTQKINAVGKSIAAANRVTYNPISKTTLDDLKRITAQFEAIKRASPNFAQEIARSGQGGKSFFDLDWNVMISNAVAREARRFGIFTKVMAGTGAGFSQPAWQGGGSNGSPPPRPPAPPGPPPGPTPGTNWWQRPGRNVVGSGLRAFGPVGGVADSALSTGLAEGAMAGLAGLAGGLVALGIGKVIGAVRDRIGAAQTENIGYDTLKRQLGDVNVSFDALKESLRASAGAIGVTFNEAQKLGSEFARLGNVSAERYGELAQEVQFGGGFSRSFGLDPSVGVSFFAQMRDLGLTRDVSDSQRLGLVIGETIVKSGAFAQSDRVLQALAGFAAQQTRLGLTRANVGGYGGALAGLVGSGIPGLDVAGAANILDRVNSAIQNGGGAGEAGQNFLYRAIGSRFNLDPIQTLIQQEQGAFGTGASTFGPGSLFARWARENNVPVPGMAAGSNETNLSATMRRLRQIYSGGGVRSELRLDAESRLFNVNHSQAMALDLIGPQRVDTLLPWLQRLGIDYRRVNSSGLSQLAQIQANGTLSDAQKAEQARAAAAAGQEKTPGSDIRDSVVGLQNTLQAYADKAVPLMTDARDALLFLAGKGAGHMMTAEDLHNAVIQGQRDTVNGRADARISKARARFTAASAVDDFGRPVDPQSQKAAYDNLQAETAAAEADRARGLAAITADDYTSRARPGTGPTGIAGLKADKQLSDFLEQTDKMLGLPLGTSAAIGMQESGLTPWAVGKRNPNGTVDLGEFQINSKNVEAYKAAFRKQYGRDPDPFDPMDSARLERMVLAGTSGSLRHRLGAYNAGPANADGTVGQAYADKVMNDRLPAIQASGVYSTPLPNGTAPATQKHEVSVALEGNFTLNHPNGTAAAAPVSVSKRVGPPQASGSTN